MNQILNLFPVPVLKGHIDPPEGLVEALAEKYEQCSKGEWALESGLSTGELGMNLHQNVPQVAYLVEQMHNCLLYTSDAADE